MTERVRVSFYVQHLLGIGHLVRAFRVADALAEDGCEVELLIGGALPEGLRPRHAAMRFLPPVRAAAGGLSALLHPDGRPFDDVDRARRRDALLNAVDARRPDVLLIEAFPFGRRQMRFELVPLLEAVWGWAARPLVVGSIRDILQANRRPERDRETVDLVMRFFDRILVHGDPALVSLADTFPAASAIADKIAYTGLVALPPPVATGAYDVVVSAGGGAVGVKLLQTALEARPLTRAAELRWLVVTGPNLPEPALARLSEKAAEGVTLARFVPDLVAALAGARLSISQAGYNTVADLLVAGCRAVLAPYAEDGETEQAVRARLLERAGRAAVIAEADLAPEVLARTIDAALAMPQTPMGLRLDGAAASAAILRRDLARHRALLRLPGAL